MAMKAGAEMAGAGIGKSARRRILGAAGALLFVLAACMTDKGAKGNGTELQVYLPARFRGVDSILICLEDSLGFPYDTLWNGPGPGDSILSASTRKAVIPSDRVSLELAGGSDRSPIRYMLPDSGVIGLPSRASFEPVVPGLTPDVLNDTVFEFSWSGGDSADLATSWRLRLGAGDSLPIFRTGLHGYHVRVDGLAWGMSYRWLVERWDGERLSQGPVRDFGIRQESPRYLDYGTKPIIFPIGFHKIIPYKAYRGGLAGFSVSPKLPEGISLDTNEGFFEGMAREKSAPADYLIKAENAFGACSTMVRLLADSVPAAEEGLVAYWDFEDGSGDTLRDRSGNGHDGIIRGGEWINGIRGGGLWFNGSTSRVTVPFDTAFNLPVYTLEAWIRTVKTDGDQAIIDRVLPDGTQWNYRMLIPGRDWILNGVELPKGVVEADVKNNFASSIEEMVLGKTYIPNGRWRHIVVTNRSRLITIYVDGKKDTARVAGPAPVTTTRREILLGDGDYSPVDFKFQGAMDEVRIYGYALDSVEVRRRFESFPPVPVIGP